MFKTFEIGSAIEAQSGMPAVDGELDLDLLIALLGESSEGVPETRAKVLPADRIYGSVDQSQTPDG